ncbi:hypothetical protein BHE74_00039686 [Ensete ventricosum]|nr:hypothetical protein BHE74_00039686 [Ensete ventricosum]
MTLNELLSFFQSLVLTELNSLGYAKESSTLFALGTFYILKILWYYLPPILATWTIHKILKFFIIFMHDLYPESIINSTARKEKPKFDSYGLGQVPHFCCAWSCKLLHRHKLTGSALLLFLVLTYNIRSQFTLVSSLEMPKADIWVVIAIISGLVGYCAKVYFT